MKPWYATNARDLLETRQQGLMPDGPVVVSMIGGEFDEVAASTLYLRPDMPLERMDWRMLVNLEVWLWASDKVPLPRVLQALDGIARARPWRLCLRFDHPYHFDAADGTRYHFDTHDVDVGQGFHLPQVVDLPPVHEFLWAPTTLQGTPLEYRLRSAALQVHQRGTVL